MVVIDVRISLGQVRRAVGMLGRSIDRQDLERSVADVGDGQGWMPGEQTVASHLVSPDFR
jgi:hypothetical protein